MSTQAAKEFSSYSFTPAVASPAPTPRQKLDEAIARLREGAQAFVRLSIDGRIELARSMQQGYLKVAERSVAAGCQAKGIAVDTPAAGEEWALGPQNRHTALNIDRHGLAAPLSLSVSRLRRWRALVRKREPIVVEHEPTA